MRSVSLSNPKVIALLNRYFVPVYVSNEDYQGSGAASAQERAELQRIFQEGYAAKKSVGSVHAYVLNPDGHLIDSLHVAEAYQAEKLAAMLERAAQTLGTAPGDPVVQPRPQSAPRTETGAVILHLTSRYLQRQGDEYALIEDAGGNWSAMPSVGWITLSRAEWTKLLPRGEAHVGQQWEPDRAVTASLLHHFYPPTENWDISTNRLDEQALKATVVSVKDGVAYARLEGRLKMKHPFYHKDDDNFAEATLVGYLNFDRVKRQITALRLVTDEAGYGSSASKQPYGVALRSLP